MHNDVEVEFRTSFITRATEIWIYRIMPNGKEVVMEPVEFKERELEEGIDNITPTLILPGRVAEQFMKGFANGLSKHGISTDNEATLQGTIAAQEKHLEDLRVLLKLSKRRN